MSQSYYKSLFTNLAYIALLNVFLVSIVNGFSQDQRENIEKYSKISNNDVNLGCETGEEQRQDSYDNQAECVCECNSQRATKCFSMILFKDVLNNTRCSVCYNRRSTPPSTNTRQYFVDPKKLPRPNVCEINPTCTDEYNCVTIGGGCKSTCVKKPDQGGEQTGDGDQTGGDNRPVNPNSASSTTDKLHFFGLNDLHFQLLSYFTLAIVPLIVVNGIVQSKKCC